VKHEIGLFLTLAVTGRLAGLMSWLPDIGKTKVSYMQFSHRHKRAIGPGNIIATGIKGPSARSIL